jgi:hypothetical protein
MTHERGRLVAAELTPDAGTDPPKGWQGLILRIATAVEPEGSPSEAIFGTLIAAAVIATKGQSGQSGAEIFLSGLLVLVLYWLAHVYADVVGERLHFHTRPGWSAIIRTALRDVSMLRGSLLPLAIFGVVRLLGASVNAAVLTALWSTIALMAMWGFVAAVRGGARGLELLVETLICALLGALNLLLKIFVH